MIRLSTYLGAVLFVCSFVGSAFADTAQTMEGLIQKAKAEMGFAIKVDVGEFISHEEYVLLYISGKSQIYVTGEDKHADKIMIQVDLEQDIRGYEWSNAPFAGVEKSAHSVKIIDKMGFQEYAIVGIYDPLTKKERKELQSEGYILAENYVVAAYALIHGIESKKKSYLIYAEAVDNELVNKLDMGVEKRSWLHEFEERFLQKTDLAQLFSEASRRNSNYRTYNRNEKTGFAGFGHRLFCSYSRCR